MNPLEYANVFDMPGAVERWIIPVAGSYISGNGRESRWARSSRTKQIRADVGIYVRHMKIPNLDRMCATQLIYFPPTLNAPDPDNLWPTDKACVDGLQPKSWPVLSDDKQEFVRRSVPHIGPKVVGLAPRLYFVVARLDGNQ